MTLACFLKLHQQEFLTRDVPYAEYGSDIQVLLGVVQGKLPKEPTDIAERPLIERRLWGACRTCWQKQNKRPTMFHLVQSLGNISSLTEGSDSEEPVISSLDLESSHPLVNFNPLAKHNFRVRLWHEFRLSRCMCNSYILSRLC